MILINLSNDLSKAYVRSKVRNKSYYAKKLITVRYSHFVKRLRILGEDVIGPFMLFGK
jgi:hypothetical protein